MAVEFKVGDMVFLRADPSRSGAIIDLLSGIGEQPRYRVFHSSNDMREYQQDQLSLQGIVPQSLQLADLTQPHTGLDADVFRARLTAQRLAHPRLDQLYALRAARIQHIPFQYKPLLRLLRADRPRLLIADEVGVGKTIEAGLILKELQTRQPLERVLIVCPKALTTKWQTEMRRFDEDFYILTSESLRYCLDETDRDGIWPDRYRRAIVHLELLRIDDYLVGTPQSQRTGLLNLAPAPQWDLIILDEAHHVRNPESRSYMVAEFLCQTSEAVVFLSATPVHVGSENLYTLLHLLRPDLFRDGASFGEVIAPNQYLGQALRYIRNQRPEHSWQADAVAALIHAAQTTWGQRYFIPDSRFTSWVQTLKTAPVLDDVQRMRCLRDLEELHPLAMILNRTRRRDIGRFTIREPQTIAVPFTPDQYTFYTALLAFRRDMLLLTYNPQIVRLIIDTLERQAASCLPALITALDSFLQHGRFRFDEVSDDPEANDLLQQVPPQLLDQARALRTLAAELPPVDPKLEQLCQIIEASMVSPGSRKVLIFSFFLHTLAYLTDHLRQRGYRVAIVSGRLADDERAQARDRFRLPSTDSAAIDVLLSSEVGCEGLDYEFCDRLVNYDIPWNPMRVEQRIGRIDRFGQTSDKVLIFNFVTPDTVEERIFYRCFERLGIFRDTLGDLEAVLGEVVEDLTRLVLNPSLTPEQAEEQARQTADNALRVIEEQRRLEAESASLIGFEPNFSSELETLINTGRFVAPVDLRLMIDVFLLSFGSEAKLTSVDRRPGIDRLRLRRETRLQLAAEVRRLPRRDRATLDLIRWLEGTEALLEVTFDQSMALQDRTLPFITPVHPLAQLAIQALQSAPPPLLATLQVHAPELAAGRYVFICDLWETIGAKSDQQLVTGVWSLTAQQLAPEVANQILRLFGQARQGAEAPLDDVALNQAQQAIDEWFVQQRQATLNELQLQNAMLLERKQSALDSFYAGRLKRVASELAQAREPRIVRMKEAEQHRIAQEAEQKQAELATQQLVDLISQRLAAGILEITHAN